jgi:hypothetical protein
MGSWMRSGDGLNAKEGLFTNEDLGDHLSALTGGSANQSVRRCVILAPDEWETTQAGQKKHRVSQEKRKTMAAPASGKCSVCAGSGKMPDGKACFKCKGNGQCPHCQGTGYAGGWSGSKTAPCTSCMR